ncbi:MAG: hypothetical protein HY649_10550 [Acidobacteria bacterium]|nr:hypothetical protein [Acidobacteriota bacterium]
MMQGKPVKSRQRSGEEGYILLVLVLFTALLVIGASRILPKAVFQGQREREEELIFRGMEYQRAIQSFVRKFGRYPNTVEELEETNKLRFLRKQYRDPMTEEGEWRLIRVGPGGTFPGSVTMTVSPFNPAGGQASSQGSRQEEESEPEESSRPGFGANPSQFSLPGFSQPTAPAQQLSATPTATPTQQPRAAASGQQSPQQVFGGGGIAGVASMSEERSIKVWNTRTYYNEWEFIYDFRADPLGTAAIARTTGGVAQPMPQTATQPGIPASGTAPATQQPPALEQPPVWLGRPPGIRPTPGQFPPSPIPGVQPPPRQR